MLIIVLLFCFICCFSLFILSIVLFFRIWPSSISPAFYAGLFKASHISSAILFIATHSPSHRPSQGAKVPNQLYTCTKEKKRGGELEKMREAGRSQWWWENPIDEMGLEEVELLKSSMEELKKNVTTQVYQLMNAYSFGYGHAGLF